MGPRSPTRVIERSERAAVARAIPIQAIPPGRANVPGPRCVAVVLLAAGVILLPWTAWLVVSLPSTQTAHHWDLAWAGFDVALTATLLTAGLAARRRSPNAAPAAIGAATLLACDAWFDILTARGVGELAMAGREAVVVELPLAVLCLGYGLRLMTAGAGAKPLRPVRRTSTYYTQIVTEIAEP